MTPRQAKKDKHTLKEKIEKEKEVKKKMMEKVVEK